MKEICKHNYPKIPEGSSTSFYENCALALVMHKDNQRVHDFLKFTEHTDIMTPIY